MNNEAPFFFLGCLITAFVCFCVAVNLNVPIHPSSYAIAEEVCKNNDGLRQWSKDNFLGIDTAEYIAYCKNGNSIDFTAQARKAIKAKNNE